MFLKKIVLKKDTSSHDYNGFCNMMEEQGVFMTCGNCDDKWIIGQWETEIDFLIWAIAVEILRIDGKLNV